MHAQNKGELCTMLIKLNFTNVNADAKEIWYQALLAPARLEHLVGTARERERFAKVHRFRPRL